MNIFESINQFYYDMFLNELELMNKVKLDPNLSYNSFIYLNIISYKENCTVSMLADMLQVTKPAATIKVNELERHGYLNKIQSTDDKRVYFLEISEEIKKIFQLYDSITLRIAKKLEETCSKEEITSFCNLLTLINQYSWEFMKNA